MSICTLYNTGYNPPKSQAFNFQRRTTPGRTTIISSKVKSYIKDYYSPEGRYCIVQNVLRPTLPKIAQLHKILHS